MRRGLPGWDFALRIAVSTSLPTGRVLRVDGIAPTSAALAAELPSGERGNAPRRIARQCNATLGSDPSVALGRVRPFAEVEAATAGAFELEETVDVHHCDKCVPHDAAALGIGDLVDDRAEVTNAITAIVVH